MPLYNQGEADGESRTIVVKKLKEPDRYRVLLHNDDYTSMDFVINILCGVFHKPLEEATAIMLAVHQQGVGQCGLPPQMHHGKNSLIVLAASAATARRTGPP